MPQPSTSLATLRPDLADSLQEFDVMADAMNLIGPRVLPVIQVDSQAGNFGRISVEDLLIDPDTRRAPRSGYNQGDWNFDDGTYSCLEHGWEEPVDDRERRAFQNYTNLETLATARAQGVILRSMEKRIADLVFNTTTWTGASLTTAVTNEWDDATNATPVADVEAAVQKVYDGTGLWPNALVINRKVFRNLRNCDEIRDRIESAGAGDAAKASDVTEAMLAAVFDLDYILVAGGSKNTANRGASASISQIWSDEYAMVCKVATDPNNFAEPCIGRTFHWAEDGSSPRGTVETYRHEGIRSNVVRVRTDTDEQILYPQCGHLLSNITT